MNFEIYVPQRGIIEYQYSHLSLIFLTINTVELHKYTEGGEIHSKLKIFSPCKNYLHTSFLTFVLPVKEYFPIAIQRFMIT